MNNHRARLFLTSLFITLLLMSSSARANGVSGGSNNVTLVAPSQIKWMPSPQLPHVQVAVMDGDPKKLGSPYTMRLRLPDGYTIPLHRHPDTERLTVLSGIVLFGAGDRLDPTKTTALGPGSYIVIPAMVPHWVTANGPTIFQVSGTGPFKVNFVR